MVSVVFRSNRFVVVDKPSMWLSTPSRLGGKDPRPCLGKYLEKAWGVRLFPVHRLDYEVSGLLLLAFDAQSHKVANHWFEARWVKKTYEAFTSPGASKEKYRETLEWRSQVLRGKRRTYESNKGQWAITRSQLKGEVQGQAWWHWELEPVTGRPHQLRFELSRQGFPIVGDELYGSTEKWSRSGIALRSVGLDFASVPEALGLPEKIQASPLINYFNSSESASEKA